MSPEITFHVTDAAGNQASHVATVEVAQQGLQIAPPVGPFTEVDGGGTDSNGVYYGAFELEQGSSNIQKVHAHHHVRVNAGAMNWHDGKAWPTAPPVLLEDCILEDASADPPRSLNGTAEANLWAGCTGTYRRFVCRRGAWMGIWTGGATDLAEGGCYGSIFEDFEALEQPQVGMYLEHTTRFCVFRRFRVEAPRPINVEWWFGDTMGTHDVVLEDFELIYTGTDDKAIFVDAGNFGITIRNGVIKGGGAIYLPNNRVVDRPNVVENVTDENGAPIPVEFHGNATDYTGATPPNNPPVWWES